MGMGDEGGPGEDGPDGDNDEYEVCACFHSLDRIFFFLWSCCLPTTVS